MKTQIRIFCLPILCTSFSEAALSSIQISEIASLPNSEINHWDVFQYAHIYDLEEDGSGGVNIGPNGAELSQLESAAFIVGSGNIYSHTVITRFEISDSPSYVSSSNGIYVGNVILELKTLGNIPNNGSFAMTYTTLNELGVEVEQEIPLDPYGISAEYIYYDFPINGEIEISTDGTTTLQWDLTGLEVISYTISFQADGTSMSLDKADLYTISDEIPFFSVLPVPEPNFLSLLLLSLISLRRSRG